jgi:phosphate starvation-inducible PhoH-like protein
MFMFLTRLGFGSKTVITGDITQIDLPPHKQSGLVEARHALRKKSTVMIKGKTKKDNTPFDLLTDRYLSYDIKNPGGIALSS